MLAEKMKQRLQPYVDGDMAGFRMQVLLAHAPGNWLPICHIAACSLSCICRAILVPALPLQHVYTATSPDPI